MLGRGSILIILIALSVCQSGCQTLQKSVSTTAPASQPLARVAKNQILVQFETMDCPCNLGDINAALMQLEGVTSVKWDYDNDRVFLQFIDDRRPSDDQITRAIRLTPVQLKKIEHP